MCRSNATNTMIHSAYISIDTKTVPVGLFHAATFVTVENKTLNALIDSCASENFISEKIVKLLSLKTFPLFNYVPEKC